MIYQSQNIKHLNRPITGNGIEAVIKRPPTKDHMDPTVNFYQTLKEGLITVLLNGSTREVAQPDLF